VILIISFFPSEELNIQFIDFEFKVIATRKKYKNMKCKIWEKYSLNFFYSYVKGHVI